MMNYEVNLGPQSNKIDIINNDIETLDEKKTYHQLEKLNDVTFDRMWINKTFGAEIEKLKDNENKTKNGIKSTEKSILELENMEKNKKLK